MQLFSTNDNKRDQVVSFKEAIFKSMPVDNGLFMPTSIPKLPSAFFQQIEKHSFQEIAFEVAQALIGDEIPAPALRNIVEDAINFDAPVVTLDERLHVLELFHGPTLAFKDFGARFMARVMSWFLQKDPAAEDIHILVATSGDTGGAVAQGFLNVPGIHVTLLYPKEKVSDLQEKQLTTVGNNVTALEIDGTFDDCQRMVKLAFLDRELNEKLNLSSANSINISRLVPQSFYYFNAYAQLKREVTFDPKRPIVFSVPSGNFGNLCGGLIAKHMGLPIQQIIASTNVNDIVPDYLFTGSFKPRPSVRTISNAMDVGNPSNFARLKAFYKTDGTLSEAEVLAAIQRDIAGKRYTDIQTREAMREVYQQYNGYIMCPHTAVGYLGLKEYMRAQNQPVYGIILATAHPAKFIDVVEEVTEETIPLPYNLQLLLNKEKQAVAISHHYDDLKAYLLQKF
jgi:threonine synthase